MAVLRSESSLKFPSRGTSLSPGITSCIQGFTLFLVSLEVYNPRSLSAAQPGVLPGVPGTAEGSHRFSGDGFHLKEREEAAQRRKRDEQTLRNVAHQIR
jgi:hypothetical protein